MSGRNVPRPRARSGLAAGRARPRSRRVEIGDLASELRALLLAAEEQGELGLHGTAELTKYAIREGLTSLDG